MNPGSAKVFFRVRESNFFLAKDFAEVIHLSIYVAIGGARTQLYVLRRNLCCEGKTLEGSDCYKSPPFEQKLRHGIRTRKSWKSWQVLCSQVPSLERSGSFRESFAKAMAKEHMPW